MHSRAVVPYASALGRFPSYLQQLEMESNGKRVDRTGNVVNATAVPVWGGAGTDGQHAYFQFLHQGTEFVPVDLIGFAKSRVQGESAAKAQQVLLANLVAQASALAFGAASTDPHRYYPGNRPVNVIMAEKLTPRVLGQLVALYEHRVFVQGAIWNVNSFDQWGVELGKSLATRIAPRLLQNGREYPSANGNPVTPPNDPAMISENRTLSWIKSHLY